MSKPTFVRINVDEPSQMAKLLRSGMIWKVQAYWPRAIEAVKNGVVPINECKDIPPEAMGIINGR